MRSRLLARPAIYRATQAALGAWEFRRSFLSSHARPAPGERVLDLGCGTADVLDHLPDVDYVGFDPNPRYVEEARRRFGPRGLFTVDRRELAGAFDLVLAMGVLHHLDDAQAAGLVGLAADRLAGTGRLVTFDPCRVAGQHPIARLLIALDRGRHVRTREGYRAIVESRLECVRETVHHDLLRVPYTHLMLEARSRAGGPAPGGRSAGGP